MEIVCYCLFGFSILSIICTLLGHLHRFHRLLYNERRELDSLKEQLEREPKKLVLPGGLVPWGTESLIDMPEQEIDNPVIPMIEREIENMQRKLNKIKNIKT